MATIHVDHFSDVLCVWAYVAQIRMDELAKSFGKHVSVKYHFFSVFGDVPGKMEKDWAHRGGLEAYSAHVHSVVEKFDHIRIHPDIWVHNTPKSSLPAHLALAAMGAAEAAGRVAKGSQLRFLQSVRDAFFVEARDISNRMELLAIAEHCKLPVQVLRDGMDSGLAHTLICSDMHKTAELGVKYSPTLIFNEGRQKLAGNVGYRIIEANIRELLENPAEQCSWC